VRFFYSKKYSPIRRIIPISFFRKKRVHDFSFVMYKGFSPWSFKKDRVSIYLMRFPLSGVTIEFYLLYDKDGNIRLCYEVRKNNLIVYNDSFTEKIARRKYSINIIIVGQIIQLTMYSNRKVQSLYAHFNMDLGFGLIYSPDLGRDNNSIIKMEYK